MGRCSEYSLQITVLITGWVFASAWKIHRFRWMLDDPFIWLWFFFNICFEIYVNYDSYVFYNVSYRVIRRMFYNMFYGMFHKFHVIHGSAVPRYLIIFRGVIYGKGAKREKAPPFGNCIKIIELLRPLWPLFQENLELSGLRKPDGFLV